MRYFLSLFLVLTLSSLSQAQSPNLFSKCSLGEAVRICAYVTEGDNQGLVDVYTPPNFSNRLSIKNGKLASAIFNSATQREDIYLSNIDGSDAELFVSLDFAFEIAISPSLEKLAYIFRNDLFVYDASDGSTTLVRSRVQGLDPAEWSADSEYLIFKGLSGETGSNFWPIMRKKADGTGDEQLITNPTPNVETDQLVDASFDGTKYLVSRFTNSGPNANTTQLLLVSTENGTSVQVLVPNFVTDAQFSGDDSRVAYLGGNTEDSRGIYIIDFEDGGDAGLLSLEWPGLMPTWSNELIEWTGSQGLIVNDPGPETDFNITDDLCDADPNTPGEQCTLAAAIDFAAAGSGPATITFDLPGNPPYQLSASNGLSVSSQPVIIDGTSQPGYDGTPIVHIDGNGSSTGIHFAAGESSLMAVSMGGFSGPALTLSGPGGNSVTGSNFGVDGSMTATPNEVGILISNSPNNMIGGIENGEANIISGNETSGLIIDGNRASGNLIKGNFIGTNGEGLTAIPNTEHGLVINEAPGNMIGGASAAERNIISGNLTHGILIQGQGARANKVQGNYIGIGADGNLAIPNGEDDSEDSGDMGVMIISAPNNEIGGPTSSAGQAPGNLIGANASDNIHVVGSLSGDGPANGTKILGNVIGSNLGGTEERPSGQRAITLIGAANDTRIGDVGAGNLIANGLDKQGIWIEDLGTDAGAPSGSIIQSNSIGLTKSGTDTLGGIVTAIAILSREDDGGVPNVLVGGEEQEQGNRIVATSGVAIVGPNSSGAVVSSNTIGLLSDGQVASPAFDGIGVSIIESGGINVLDNTIGNQSIGILLAGNENNVLENRIGTNPNGTEERANKIGIFIPGKILGGPAVGDRNVIGAIGLGNTISGNKDGAIVVGGPYELPQEGAAFVNPNLELDLGAGIGPHLEKEVDKKRVAALRMESESPEENRIAFNRIGVSIGGTRELGNGRGSSADDARAAIYISDAENTTILGNIISGNGLGILLSPDDSEGGEPRKTTIAGNAIGGVIGDGANIPNQYGGVFILEGSNNVLTALPFEEGGEEVGNSILENGGQGVAILMSGDSYLGNQVRRTDFVGNKDESILLFNDDSDYPDEAPDPPSIFSITENNGSSTIRFRVSDSGEVDVFAHNSCPDGNAQGFLVATSDAAQGDVELTIQNSALSRSGASSSRAYLALTITPPGENATTSSMSDCVRIGEEGQTVVLDIPADTTGVIADSLGIAVEITANPSAPGSSFQQAGGTIYLSRFLSAPERGQISTNAQSHDGSSITVNEVATAKYWTLRSDSLNAITYNVCMDLNDIGGISNAEQLVVVHRERAGQDWTAFDSTLEADRLCAMGLTSLGELAVAGDSLVNPVPIEETVGDLPTDFSLSAAYPNPFNPISRLELSMVENAPVLVEVFDDLGRRVKTLVDRELSAGRHMIVFDASQLPSGVYILTARTEGRLETRRVTLLK